MSVAIVTGSSGLVGSEACRHFAALGFDVVGIDNDLRGTLFGDEASTAWQRDRLCKDLGTAFTHVDADIRDADAIRDVFRRRRGRVALVIHAAAQPSHDWAKRDPATDFSVNATGTLNLLEATRHDCPDAVFVFTSTNKVYGDTPNRLPFVETETRYTLLPGHRFEHGVDESMSIDQSLHSLFGASKVAADSLVQEYGRSFDLRTVCFRCGCLTGPNHSGAQLHGFLAYLMRCVVAGQRYTVFGYDGRQVRDNLHSSDLAAAFEAFFKAPRSGAVYNLGGGVTSNCSMREAISLCEEIAQRPLDLAFSAKSRSGDHKWWITDTTRFEQDYPEWSVTRDVRRILDETYEANVERWGALVS